MSKYRVNYDQIAATYNQRYQEDERGDEKAAALRALAEKVNAKRVLEVGCGTGRWLPEFFSSAANVYGLDLSAGMLNQARRRGQPFRLTRGQGHQLPFADSSFDLVYCVNAIHHFVDACQFVAEARRLLRPGGAFAVVGMGPQGRKHTWYVYHYFEGTFEVDLERFPSWGNVVDWMVAQGFSQLDWRVVETIIDHKIGRVVLDDPFLRQHSCSQLALLSDADYAAGIEKIKAALDQADARGETLTFNCELAISMLTGRID